MNSCPSPTDPAWKELVSYLQTIDPIYGYANAMTAFYNNGSQTPTPEEAVEILRKLKALDKDEAENRKSNEEKLVRQREQYEIVKAALGQAKYTPQKETLGKIQKMLLDYQDFLEENIKAINEGRSPKKTVSVTKFTGTSDFNADPKMYESYKYFGTFMHDFLEKLQVQAVRSGKTIKDVMSFGEFSNVYDKFIAKYPFEIQNLTKDEMFAMAEPIVNSINVKNAAGFIILPEITAIGETKDGTKLVGRLDLLMIDPLGRIHIYDFKTKKLTTKYETSIEPEVAMIKLAQQSYNISTKEKGTGDKFRELQGRSAYDTWMMQLGTYENMLMQNGLEIRDKTVLALLYQTNTEGKYISSLLKEFDNDHYYDYTANIDLEILGYYGKEWFANKELVNDNITRIKNAINIETPVQGKTVVNLYETQTENAKIKEEFTPNEQKVKDFITILDRISDAQIKNAYKDLKTAKQKPVQDKELIELIQKRIDALKNFQKIYQKISEGTTDGKENVLYASNFFAALSTLDAAVKNMTESSNKALDIYDNTNLNFLSPKKTNALNEIREAYNNSIIYDEILVAMENLINDISKQSDSKKETFAEVRTQLNDMRAQSQAVQANFKHVGLLNSINVVQSLGTKVFERVEQQLDSAIQPRIEQLKLEIARLKENSKLGIFKQLKLRSFMLLNKDYRQKIKDLMGPDGDIIQAEIIKLETELQKLEWAKKGYSYSEDAIKTIVNGITNHDSYFYPGMQNPLQGDTLLSGWNADTLIASAGNSDVMIASMVNLLKNAKAEAEKEALSDPNVQTLAKTVESLRDKGFTIEQLDSLISETVDISYYDTNETDPSQGKIKKKSKYTLALPYTESYANTYLDGYYRIRELSEELNKLEKEARIEKDEIERKIKLQRYNDKKKERDQHVDNFTKWKVENCTLEYSDEFYQLQLKIPQDLREKMQAIYMEQNEILFSIGITDEKLDPVMLQEEDFHRLKNLQYDLRKLKQEAKEQNPEYAKYIEEFDKFYETEIDERYFERMRQNAQIMYSDDAEGLKKWEKEHTVTRPTEAWFSEIQDLYNERALIFSNADANYRGSFMSAPASPLVNDAYYDISAREMYVWSGKNWQSVVTDKQIKDKLEEKNRILRRYKTSGRLNPRYFTDEEIRELDEIEGDIEEIIMEKQEAGYTLELTEDKRERLSTISNSLRRLVSKSLSTYYQEDFKTKTNKLKLTRDELRTAESKVKRLEEKGASKAEIDEAIAEFEVAEKNFLNTQIDYAKWYDRNHEGKYFTEIKTIYLEDNIEAVKVPKQFNYERLPSATVAKQYMETVPNPMYYKLKKPRLGNWTLTDADGKNPRKLTNKEIEEYNLDPQKVLELKMSGRLDIKPGAYNPNFKKMKPINGVPLPKELESNYDGNIPESATNSKYDFRLKAGKTASANVNQKYLDILNNKDISDLYFSTLNTYLGLQNTLEGNVSGYDVPGFAAKFGEVWDQTGSIKEAFSTSINTFIDKNLKRDSQQDINENIYGDLGSKIRSRFVNQLENGMQTKGALNAIVKWSAEAHMAKAMQTVSPVSTAYVEYMKTQRDELIKQKMQGDPYVEHPYLKDKSGKPRKVKIDLEKKIKEFDNFINIIEFENNKILYGITDTEQNRQAKKIANTFFAYTSFIRIGFDLANQVKNLVSGNVQAYLAAGNFESSHYSNEDYLFGVKQFGVFCKDFLSDYGRITDLKYNTLLYRTMNPAQKDHIKYFNDVVTGKKGSGIGGIGKSMKLKAKNDLLEFAYLLQDKGDTQIAVTVMYAVMNSYKYKKVKERDASGKVLSYELDSNGQPILVPAHAAYVEKNGILEIDPMVDYTKEDEKFLRNVIYSEVRRAQGNYAKVDQTPFESKLLGRVMFFFKKFLVPQLLNRFGHMRANWEDGGVAVGYWRATWDMLFNLEGFSKSQFWAPFFLGTKVSKKLGVNMNTYTVKDPKTGKPLKQIDVGDYYAKHLTHARKDAFMMAILTILSMMALSYVKRKDDDDEEIDMLTGNLIRVLWGVKGETVSMMPVGQGSNEYIKNFTTAIPFVREFTSFKNLLNHAAKTIFLMSIGESEEPSERWEDTWKEAYYSRKTGSYEKGDSKLAKDFADLLPFWKSFRDLFTPENRLDVMQKTQ